MPNFDMAFTNKSSYSYGVHPLRMTKSSSFEWWKKSSFAEVESEKRLHSPQPTNMAFH